jgi:hypothetical protein
MLLYPALAKIHRSVLRSRSRFLREEAARAVRALGPRYVVVMCQRSCKKSGAAVDLVFDGRQVERQEAAHIDPPHARHRVRVLRGHHCRMARGIPVR